MNPLCTILCAIFKNLSSFLSLTRHVHGDPADHDADGRASRGQRDKIIGAEGVEGSKFAGALCGWGCRVASFRLSVNEGSYSECVALATHGWKAHIDPDQCDALLCPKVPPARHPHGDPAVHDADGCTGRGQRDPIVGEEGVEGEKFARALCGWGFDLAQPNGG